MSSSPASCATTALAGSRALGFIKNPQRMNVLLSRAKQKLVLATSRQFIRDVVEGIDPDGMNDELEFLRKMLKELSRLGRDRFRCASEKVLHDRQGR